METRTAVLKRFLPRLAGVLLGSVLLVLAWGPDVRGKNGPKPKDLDSTNLAGGASEASPQGGEHLGERRQLEVEITFWGEYGQTVTDENGTHYYHYSGTVKHEDKVYPPEYWGVFTLYYFNRSTGITVTIRNNGPRKKAKVVVRTEAYQLQTDGSSGHSLTAPREIEVEVARGETKTIDASFIVLRTPESQSGLNRFLVKVLHGNEGAAAGEPALIGVREGVFCPPDDAGEETEEDVF